MVALSHFDYTPNQLRYLLLHQLSSRNILTIVQQHFQQANGPNHQQPFQMSDK